MRVKVIRPFTDKYTVKSIKKDTVIEVSDERFLELTKGPLGIFVEEIVEKKPARKITKKVGD